MTQPDTRTPGLDAAKLKVIQWVLGISLGIGLLVVLNQLQVPYYLYYPQTTHTVLISDAVDFYFFLVTSMSVPAMLVACKEKISKPVIVGLVLVWVVSLALTILNEPFAVVILYAVVFAAVVLGWAKSEDRKLLATNTLLGTVTILVLVECSSVFYWAVVALNPHQHFGFMSQSVEADLTYSLYPVAIPLFLLLLFAWLWIPLLGRLLRSKGRFKVRYEPTTSKWDLRSLVTSLDLVGMFSVIMFFFSYLAGQAWVVGVDSHWRYLDPLNQLNGLSPSQALHTSYTHGTYLVALYAIELGTGISSFTIVKFAPLILTFCTASAVLFVAHSAGWRLELGLLAATSTLAWFPTTLGIYAGIQANWVALFFWMLFLGIYFLKHDWTIITYAVAGVLSLGILLVHPWTWGVFISTLALTTFLVRRTGFKQDCLRGLFAALIIAVPVGLIAYSLLPGLGEDFANTIQLYFATPSNPLSLYTIGGAIVELFTNWSSSISPTLLLISLMGASTLIRRQGLIPNYLVSWIAIWCIGTILVAPSGFNPANTGISETGIWRMLYVSPLPFLLALGLQRLLQLVKPERTMLQTNPGRVLTPGLPPIVSTAIILVVGGGLFLTWDPGLRLLLVLCALAVTLIMSMRLPQGQCLQALLALLLAFVLLNAAFRFLSTLLLDPHNLFSSVSGPTGK